MRKIVILAEGAFEWHYGKTATGVIRYGHDTVVAVIDSSKIGMDVSQALGGASFGHGIPVVRDVNEALKYRPDSLCAYGWSVARGLALATSHSY